MTTDTEVKPMDAYQALGFLRSVVACGTAPDESTDAAFEAIRSELERLRADARRYRWLRMMCDSECSIGGFENPGTAIAGVVGFDFNGSRSFQRCDGEQLDSAIDAAQQEGSRDQSNVNWREEWEKRL